MIDTTYTCDRCGKSSKSSDFLKSVGCGVIGVSYITNNKSFYGDYNNKEWCMSCITETGLHRTKDEEKKETLPPPLTFEEMIREIIREEIQNQ